MIEALVIISLAAAAVLIGTFHSGRGTTWSNLEMTAFAHAPAFSGLLVASETKPTIEVAVVAVTAGIVYTLGVSGASYRTIAKWPFYLINSSLAGALIAFGFLGLHQTLTGRVALLLVHLGLYHHTVVVT